MKAWGASWKIMESHARNHGEAWKIMEDHGRNHGRNHGESWKIMEDHGSPWDILDGRCKVMKRHGRRKENQGIAWRIMEDCGESLNIMGDCMHCEILEVG